MHGKDDTEEKRSIEEYKRDNSDYISTQLKVNVTDLADAEVVTEEE